MKMIKSMTIDELIVKKAQIEAAIQRHVANERQLLMKAIDRISVKKSPKPGRKRTTHPNSLKGKKLPPLYRNPKNPNETWAGRGLRPRWLVAALKMGKKIQAFAIK